MRISIGILLLLSTLLWGESVDDRTVQPLDNTKVESVKEAFRILVQAYKDKDINRFMHQVNEDQFQQDYMTFEDAIRQDFRIYTLYNLDYWFEQFTPDQETLMYVKVRWRKEYEQLTTSQMQRKRGVSWFLFSQHNHEYKLIAMAGEAMWGESRLEWLQETPISTKKMK